MDALNPYDEPGGGSGTGGDAHDDRPDRREAVADG